MQRSIKGAICSTDFMTTTRCEHCTQKSNTCTGRSRRGHTFRLLFVPVPQPTTHQIECRICPNATEVLRYDNHATDSAVNQQRLDVTGAVEISDIAIDSQNSRPIRLGHLLLDAQFLRRECVIDEHCMGTQQHSSQECKATIPSADVNDCEVRHGICLATRRASGQSPNLGEQGDLLRNVFFLILGWSLDHLSNHIATLSRTKGLRQIAIWPLNAHHLLDGCQDSMHILLRRRWWRTPPWHIL
mmetsp:Transcript_158433/g.508220  ORF Transcript_158433/g.508220 Transcript_158433/m.508220 type:complete len:243 (-) Transcript_158433:324-1052(-)